MLNNENVDMKMVFSSLVFKIKFITISKLLCAEVFE